MILPILYGIAGALMGWMITETAENFTKYKYQARTAQLIGTQTAQSLPLRITLTLLNAGIWAFAVQRLGDPFASLFIALLMTVAIIIVLIDVRIRMIPNELVLVVMVLGILFQLLHYGTGRIIPAAFSMIALMILLIVVAAIIGFEKVGAGDVKLIAAMGLALGYPDILSALYIMSLAMGAYCVLGCATFKLTKASMFPFAPFIMLGMSSSLIFMIMT